MEAVRAEMISYPSNGEQTPGYLARLEGSTGPGIVLIQEFWGLVGHIKDVAKRLAGQGYIVLAPDLYHGKEAVEPDEARKLAMDLDRERAVKEIQAAVGYLRGLDEVSPKKIGVVGFCMGGSLTISTAARSPDIDAAVVFYGTPRGDLNAVRNITAPVLALYGENDQGIPLETVREFEQVLVETNIPHQVYVYPDAGHAFFNDERPSHYHAHSAQDAWTRMLAWFLMYLKS